LVHGTIPFVYGLLGFRVALSSSRIPK
jgi:hypothetical protein